MMLCPLPRCCLVQTFDRFDSDKWFSCDQVIFLVFRVFLLKSVQHLSDKMQFPGFLFPQVVRSTSKVWWENKGRFDCLFSQ